MIDDYIAAIVAIVREYGVAAIFVGLILESTIVVGIVVPGIVVMVVAGFLSAQGVLDLRTSIIVGTLAVVLGDQFSFLLGRWGVLRWKWATKYAPQMAAVRKKLESSVWWTLLLFHFPVYSRLFVPAMLGALRIDVRRWLLLDTIGALLFTSAFMGVGYATGRAAGVTLDVALDAGADVQVVVTIVITLVLVALIARAWWRKNR